MTQATHSPAIFISYRRSDSKDIAGRIYDRLSSAFGSQYVFKDTYTIKPGDDFRQIIRQAIDDCQTVLVLIGTDWLTTTQNGIRRLDDPNDWVRIEIEMALNQKNIRTVPILLDGARMPTESDLPASLGQLAYCNALQIRSDPDFDADISRLIAEIKGDGHQTIAQLKQAKEDLTKQKIAKQLRLNQMRDESQSMQRTNSQIVEAEQRTQTVLMLIAIGIVSLVGAIVVHILAGVVLFIAGLMALVYWHSHKSNMTQTQDAAVEQLESEIKAIDRKIKRINQQIR